MRRREAGPCGGNRIGYAKSQMPRLPSETDMRRLDPFGCAGYLQLAGGDSGKRLITIGRGQRACAKGAGALIDDTDHKAVTLRVGPAVEEFGERKPLADEIGRFGGLIQR